MSDAPSDSTMAQLPQFMIFAEDETNASQGTNNKVQAEQMAHAAARQHNGKYIAVYQRVVLIRKNT